MHISSVPRTFAPPVGRGRPRRAHRRALAAALFVAYLLVTGGASAQGALTVWSYAPSTVAQQWLQQPAEEYGEATGTVVTVRIVAFEGLRDRLMQSAEHGPDLVATVPHDWLPGLVESGVVAALDGLVDDVTLRSVSPVALDAFSSGGSLFGLPIEIEGVAPRPPSTACGHPGRSRSAARRRLPTPIS